MRSLVLAAVVGLSIAALPADGWAQAGRARGRMDRDGVSSRVERDRARRDVSIADVLRGRTSDRDRDVYRRDRYDRNDRYESRRGNGPPFCRNGQGHPVHGRQWCRDKGWGLGDRDRDIYRRDGDYDIYRRERDRVILDRDRRERERDRDRDRDVLDRVGDIMRGRTR